MSETEQSGSQREPDDAMARQSGAVSEDLQPVASSDRPDETAEEGSSADTVEPPTDPGRSPLRPEVDHEPTDGEPRAGHPVQ